MCFWAFLSHITLREMYWLMLDLINNENIISVACIVRII